LKKSAPILLTMLGCIVIWLLFTSYTKLSGLPITSLRAVDNVGSAEYKGLQVQWLSSGSNWLVRYSRSSTSDLGESGELFGGEIFGSIPPIVRIGCPNSKSLEISIVNPDGASWLGSTNDLGLTWNTSDQYSGSSIEPCTHLDN
jgi:hypothetical protein